MQHGLSELKKQCWVQLQVASSLVLDHVLSSQSAYHEAPY